MASKYNFFKPTGREKHRGVHPYTLSGYAMGGNPKKLHRSDGGGTNCGYHGKPDVAEREVPYILSLPICEKLMPGEVERVH